MNVTVMDSFDVTRIVDGVIKGLSEGLYVLPKEFKEVVQKGYHLPTVTIPCQRPGDFLTLQIYITNEGSMIWRVVDAMGTLLYERGFQ